MAIRSWLFYNPRQVSPRHPPSFYFKAPGEIRSRKSEPRLFVTGCKASCEWQLASDWPILASYWPMSCDQPLTGPCDRDNVSAHRRLSVSQGIRLLSPNKCRHWRSSTFTSTRIFEDVILVGPSPFSCSHPLALTHEPISVEYIILNVFKIKDDYVIMTFLSITHGFRFNYSISATSNPKV